MRIEFKPGRLQGNIEAPPSKSMAHRYLISSALSKEICQISGVDFSDDILATIDCLKALGADITIQGDNVCINPNKFLQDVDNSVLDCRESGSTLRFFIPLTLCLGKKIKLCGSTRLFERPLDVYEELCREKQFIFDKYENSVVVCGKLESGTYKIRGDISSQFITGLLFALIYMREDASIEIIPPFESRAYVDMTIDALNLFGADIKFTDEYHISIKKSVMKGFSGSVEGDYSNAAFLDAFNYIDSDVKVANLNPESLQGDKVYAIYFKEISKGVPTIDISNCPDLGPVLIALAALNHGAVLKGTDRLKIKESDRGKAMHMELTKLGGGLIMEDDSIIVPKQELKDKGFMLDGHHDHRIVMALSLVLSKTGGTLEGAEAVKKSYPEFFDDIEKLGAKIERNVI